MPIQLVVETAAPAVVAESEAAKRLLPGACVVSTSGNVPPKYGKTNIIDGVVIGLPLRVTECVDDTVADGQSVAARDPPKDNAADGEREGEALAVGVVTAKFFVSEPWMLMPSPVVGVHVAP